MVFMNEKQCLRWFGATALLWAGLAFNQLMALEGEPRFMEYVPPSTAFSFRVERLTGNPIIHRDLPHLEGELGRNINGPSLIRVPDWVENRLGQYYLYFAHHHGSFIRLAYADELEGPWKIHPGGVLAMEQTPSYHGRRGDHVASPDVWVDEGNKQIRLYYHGRPIPGSGAPYQMTYVALSSDGLNFQSLDHQLGLFYFRVFRHHDGLYYALAKYINDGGVLYRSHDGLSEFEMGQRILPRVRHMALWQNNGMLYVFFSRGEDSPEHILVSRVENLGDDWEQWRFTSPRTVLKPAMAWEGVDEPILPSRFGAVHYPVHQLRDPAIFEEEGRLYLLYSVAGEQAIAMAELFFEETADQPSAGLKAPGTEPAQR